MKKSSGPLVGFGGLACGYHSKWDPPRPDRVFLQCEVEIIKWPPVHKILVVPWPDLVG